MVEMQKQSDAEMVYKDLNNKEYLGLLTLQIELKVHKEEDEYKPNADDRDNDD